MIKDFHTNSTLDQIYVTADLYGLYIVRLSLNVYPFILLFFRCFSLFLRRNFGVRWKTNYLIAVFRHEIKLSHNEQSVRS